jgi:hypothetical protein
MHALHFAATTADTSLWQAIIDDPRAVVTLFGSLATMITAFFGFFFGALWTHHLATKREERQRIFKAEHAQADKDAARRALAGELHAEIGWVMKRVRHVIRTVREICPADTESDQSITVQRWQWESWLAPPMAVREAHIGKLGLLPQKDARHLIRIGGMADWLNRLTTILLATFDGPESKLAAQQLHNFVNGNESIIRDLIKLNEPLARIAGVDPHNWAKAEAEVGPEPEEDDGAAEEGDPDDVAS